MVLLSYLARGGQRLFRCESANGEFVDQAKRGVLLNVPRVQRRFSHPQSQYRETRTLPSSAALNRSGLCDKARVIARWVAASSVRPQPSREQDDSIHIKCHPASRTAKSGVAGAVFSTNIHALSNGTCLRFSPVGRVQPARR